MGKVRSHAAIMRMPIRGSELFLLDSPAPKSAQARVWSVSEGRPSRVHSVIAADDAAEAALYDGAESAVMSLPSLFITACEPNITPRVRAHAHNSIAKNGSKAECFAVSGAAADRPSIITAINF